MAISSDTIFAPITAPGISPVSIIRISGKDVNRVLSDLTSKKNKILEKPNSLILAPLIDTSSSEKKELDNALFSFFKGPNSFTGEDVLEINVHGSPFIVSKLLENLTNLGLRVANAGEFTERAFLNGRMDLVQAEAVADLISAETEAQARVSKKQLDGELSFAVSDLGEPLRDLLSEIEAHIDFPEEDINPSSFDTWKEILKRTIDRIDRHLESYQQGRVARLGAEVAMLGLPNAGKSSLLNKILEEERVIVTPTPGTTRDSIKEVISLDGYKVSFWDTAGLYEEGLKHNPDEIELLGIERSWEKAKEVDLILYLIDLIEDNFQVNKNLLQKLSKLEPPLTVVFNKSDQISKTELENIAKAFNEFESQIIISAQTGEGVKELKSEIKKKLIGESKQSDLLITTQRHYECLANARLELLKVSEAVQNKITPEFIALDLRLALGHLSEIIGVTHTEDILGRIFSKFCIGK